MRYYQDEFEFKKIFKFEELGSAPLIVDAVYEGGWKKNTADEPLSKLFKGIGSGVGNRGFRISGRAPEYRYCILFTSGEDTTGLIILICGPVYLPTTETTSQLVPVSAKKGNKLLEVSFDLVHSLDADRQKIIPFLIFEKFPTLKQSVRSIWRTAIPGVEGHSVEEDLVAVYAQEVGKICELQSNFQYFGCYWGRKAVVVWSSDLSSCRHGGLG